MNRSTTFGYSKSVNVANVERAASVLGGGALIAYGLQKRSWSGFGLAALGGVLAWRGATGHCDVYQSLGIHTDRRRGRNRGVPYELGVRVDRSIVIDRPREEVYRFWRNLENLPRFMHNIQSVSEIDNKHSHWVVRGPAGTTMEWRAEIVNEAENELIGWRSMEDAEVENGGSVQFRDAAGGGTEVIVELQYNPPGGMVAASIAKLFGGDPSTQIEQDLKCLKQLIEAGDTRSRSQDKTKKTWRMDKVAEASEESFPASDAPSWTPETLPR